MSNKYKFGQIVGIVLGCVAGSVLVNMILGPRRPDHVQPPVQVQYGQQFPIANAGQQQGVFEQALSLPKS